MPAPPSLKAAVLCDQAIQEVGTGKWTLVGTFANVNRIVATKDQREGEPVVLPRLAVYFAVSGAAGEYPILVTCVHIGPEREAQIIAIKGRVGCGGSRLADTDFAVNIAGMRFPKFGKYAFRLRMGDRMVGEKVFEVRQITEAELRGGS